MKCLLQLTLCAAFVSSGAFAQNQPPEKPLLDKILEKRTFSPQETAALNKDADPAIDVRDLVIFLNGQPISAFFESNETVVFRDQPTVIIPIRFTKPVTGTIRIEMGGTAKQGKDFGSFGVQVPGFQGITTSLSVSNDTSAQITVPIANGNGAQSGEKRLTLNLQAVATLNSTTSVVTRTGNIAPGYRAAHTIVIREAWKTWIGTIDFPRESGFTSVAVRFLMGEDQSTKMVVGDSNLFDSSASANALVVGTGSDSRITFSQPVVGTYQPSGAPQQSAWALDFEDLPVQPGRVANIANYSADLQVSNFPVTGITKTVTGTMSLTLQQ
jgi:hypothetical protein